MTQARPPGNRRRERHGRSRHSSPAARARRAAALAALILLCPLASTGVSAQILGDDGGWAWDEPATAEDPVLPESSISHLVFSGPGLNGFVSLEVLQVQIGNVRAISDVRNLQLTNLGIGGVPHVVSQAVAIGNNAQIESGALDLHVGQYFFNVRSDMDGAAAQAAFDAGLIDFDSLLALLGANAGQIVPARLEAQSTVYGTGDATVESSAIAIANNLEITLDPRQSLSRTNAVSVAHGSDPDGHEASPIAFGHVTQYNNADITATASSSNGRASAQSSGNSLIVRSGDS